ncbi:DUF1206 domain-containing protein [Sediminibacillus dalangtanensis]|uniref:DUF1206 domain-containing protein n=1 Tax=Sediminibacillus dalangtanensis TaxID=2729421 RepID=UPI001FD8005D|nr:DUF1206 domain-containing protein [Sediminibacillus dalangtanensis]
MDHWNRTVRLYCLAMIRAFKDPDDYGKGIRGLAIRTGFFISALIYGGISFKALKIAVHAGSGGNSEQTMSAKLLSQPYGPWLLGIFGFVVFCFAIYEAGIGIKGSYMKKFKQGEMEEKEEKVARIAGKIGMISRGIVFGLIGFFFVQTAVTTNPDKAKGLDEALSELAQQPYGSWKLGVVSLGFILFGLYQVFRGTLSKNGLWKLKNSRSADCWTSLLFFIIYIPFIRHNIPKNASD